MARPLFILTILVPILMIDSIIEMSFVSAMVGFLLGRGHKNFEVSNPSGQNFELRGHPVGLLVNQGHTTNGAAGTGFVLIGIGGLLAIWVQKRRMRTVSFQALAKLLERTQTDNINRPVPPNPHQSSLSGSFSPSSAPSSP
jgi:hypothetical protein